MPYRGLLGATALLFCPSLLDCPDRLQAGPPNPGFGRILVLDEGSPFKKERSISPINIAHLILLIVVKTSTLIEARCLD